MRTLAIAGMLLLLPVARADILVTALPYTAYSANRYYLNADLTVPAGSLGFVVGADSVTFDLNGHTITCAGGPGVITRAVSLPEHSHFTLTGGRIRNCGFGVDSLAFRPRSANIRVDGVQFIDNYYRAIRLDVSDSEIVNNRVENTTAEAPPAEPDAPAGSDPREGAPPPDSPTRTTRSTAVAPDPSRAVALPSIVIAIEVSGKGNVIRDNTIAHVKGTAESVGISLSDEAVGSIVANNVIRNDPLLQNDYGIWVGGASSPRIVGNIIVGYSTGLAASSTTQGFYRNNTVVDADASYIITGSWKDGGNNN